MHATADIAIATRGLTRCFGETRALDDLELEIRSGEVFGLLGHNGAGKTTAVRLLNGILTPTSGASVVLGLDPTTDGSTLRKRTGVSTETPALDDRLSGRATLEIFAELFGVPAPQVASRVDTLLEQFDLTSAAAIKVGGYSKGMKQRLALARCLLHDPELLFLDEPTSGLDPVVSRQVNDLIRHLSRDEGKTVVLCTHDLGQAQALCHRVAVLEHGRLVALGRPRELARELGQGQQLLLETSPETFEHAARYVDTHASATGADTAGSVLSVSVPNRSDVPTLVAGLVAEGVELYRVELEEPSLEDVYFALHRNREGAA